MRSLLIVFALLLFTAVPAQAHHQGETEGTVHLEDGAWLPDPT